MAESNIKQVAAFLFAGAVAGATVALLLAARSSNRTTKGLKQVARETVDDLDELEGDIGSQVADLADDITGVVKEGAERAKKLGAEGYEQVLQGFDSVKKRIEEGGSRLEQPLENT